MFHSRLKKEIKDLQVEPIGGINLTYDENDMKKWKGEINGPEGTAYEGYVLRLKISIPDNYPLTSPKVEFEHPVFHPNIGNSGNICLDILNSQWSPTYTLSKVMLSISSLLNDPNPASPLNGTAAQLWKENREKYNMESRKLMEKYCKKI